MLLLTAESFAQNKTPRPNNTVTIKPGQLLGKDAMVWSNNAGANYGHVPYLVLYTWTNRGYLGVKRIYLNFDLTKIPRRTRVDSAFLHLYFHRNPNEGFTTHSGFTDAYVRRVTSIWTENGISWNNQPTNDTTNQVSVPGHRTSMQDYKINVTALVNDMLNNPRTSYGFMMRMQDEVNYYRGLQFAASELSDTSKHPKLVVNYTFTTDLDAVETIDQNIKVFPNPSSGQFTILNNNQDAQDVTYQLYDISGQQLELKANQNIETLDLSAFPKGVYFLNISNDLGTVGSRRLIVY